MSKKETIKTLKEFNAHLRNEVHELKDKLKAEEQKGKGFFHDMIETQLDDYELHAQIDKLTAENEKLKAETAKLQSQKGSIFTEPSKKELKLERQLMSERAKANEYAEKLARSDVQLKEQIEENKALRLRLAEYEKPTKEGKTHDNT